MSAAWERLNGETPHAYSAFVVFLDLGERRTVVDAYRRFAGRARAAKTPGYFVTWTRRHRWAERAAAWEDEQWRQRLAGRERRIERARQAAIDRAEDVVAELVDLALGERTSDNLSVRLGALRDAARLAGLEKTAIELTGKDGAPLQVDLGAWARTLPAPDLEVLLGLLDRHPMPELSN
jgi:hypothetical protein